MFKAARWRSEKNKIKAVFKLELHASKVTKLGWEAAMVSLVPLDVGKPTARSEKVTVLEGNCEWRKPIYETVKLVQDPKTGKINDKLYNLIVSAAGSAKTTIIGEGTINFSEYVEVTKPSTVSLPLKASDSGPMLHVTIQRVDADVQRREADENVASYVREQERRMAGQLNNNDEDEGIKALAANYVYIEDGSSTMYQAEMSSPTIRTMHLVAGSNRNLRKSTSSSVAGAMITDENSEQYTPRENGMKNHHNYDDYDSFQSPLSSTSTPRKETTRDRQGLLTCLSVTSGPEGSSDGSTNSLAETGLGDRMQNSEDQLVNDDLWARDEEVSRLELQMLRRQLVKESKRAQVLARELSMVKEERDASRRDYEEFKGSQKRPADQTVSRQSCFDGEDPWSILAEIKQELTHEKNLNANLRLQLEKTQESNSELILAVEDLEQVLEEKNGERSRLNCSQVPKKTTNSGDLLGLRFKNSDLHAYDCRQELLETTSEEDSEQYALEEVIKGHGDAKVAYSLDRQIIDLNSEIELYKKDREDLEMQMEQLALDYEILKQENHQLTSKLELYRLQEQLKMQHECSSHSIIISDLEVCIRNLKNELDEQVEAFEADIQALTHAKVQQEQRAIQAEEALRKARWETANTAEHLQEEFERLSKQMSSTFQMNEKLAMEALSEAKELHIQKVQLEKLLEETNKELAYVQCHCHEEVQGLSNLISVKTKETDKLLLELKQKAEEIQNLKNCKDARVNATSEETAVLKTEVERLSRENNLISEELEKKTQQVAELEELKASSEETEMLVHDMRLQRDALEKELTSLREAEENSVNELHDLQHLNDGKETIIRTLRSELASIRAQYNDLKNSLIEDEAEKENLRKQVFHLRGDLRKKEDAITNTEKKLKDNNMRLASSHETTKATIRNKNNTYSSSQQTSKEVATLREKIKILEGKLKLKDATMEDTKNSFLMKEKDMLKRIEELQKNISGCRACVGEGTAGEYHNCNMKNGDVPEDEMSMSIPANQPGISHSQEAKISGWKFNRANAEGKMLLQPAIGEKAGQHNLNGTSKELITGTIGTNLEETEEDLLSTKSNKDSAAEMVSKMTVLRDKNEAMEAELKEMQDRYSEISLRFAEVEGERQQLVMTVRSLKNSLKS